MSVIDKESKGWNFIMETYKFHMDPFFCFWGLLDASGCSREARIISVHLTASCSSISLSLYWFLSISTRAISTLVNLFLWAIGTSSYKQNTCRHIERTSELRYFYLHTKNSLYNFYKVLLIASLLLNPNNFQ